MFTGPRAQDPLAPFSRTTGLGFTRASVHTVTNCSMVASDFLNAIPRCLQACVSFQWKRGLAGQISSAISTTRSAKSARFSTTGGARGTPTTSGVTRSARRHVSEYQVSCQSVDEHTRQSVDDLDHDHLWKLLNV